MPVFQLSEQICFPPPEMAEPDGLLAIGGDLTPERLLEAYRQGIFPWFSEGDPILWWSPAPRLVLFPREFHLPRRLARIIRQSTFTLKADSSFREVIEKCAGTRLTRGSETWITADMTEAYCRLHELGYAHSIECWHNGYLAGGLYGVMLGRVFFGESMFSAESNASKVALQALVRHAEISGIRLIDCQMKTEHLVSLGAREIPGRKFQELLQELTHPFTAQKKWRLQQTDKEGVGPAGACQEERRK